MILIKYKLSLEKHIGDCQRLFLMPRDWIRGEKLVYDKIMDYFVK